MNAEPSQDESVQRSRSGTHTTPNLKRWKRKRTVQAVPSQTSTPRPQNYQVLAGVQLKAQIAKPDNPLDRPDISVFDLGLGFQNSDLSQPITIIEFKRPKRDNYTLEKNPIAQVRKYVKDMRNSGQAIKFDGTPLRQIADTTPFVCHIIADVTPSLRSAMRDLGPFHQKIGSGTWYRWDDAYNIFIEISSFKDVLDSAKLRNKAFFEKIGLL